MKIPHIIQQTPQLLSAAALLLSVASVSFADQSSAQKPEASAEVVELPGLQVESSHLYSDQINALKTPTPIIDVPQSLSVVGSEEIKLRGFDQIGDIVDYTPGVNMSQGEGHRDSVVFRGVRSTADFFVDGVRDDVQYYRPLYNVEQIEILRGPNALFFGRGGAGGVVNRVMKKGEVTESFNAYTFGVNSFGGVDLQWDSNTSISENSAFRINTFYDHLENHREFFNGERFGVNPTFRFILSEKTTLDISYEYMDHERFIDRGIPSDPDGNPATALDDIVFGDPNANKSTLDAHVFRATVQHRFADALKGNLTASYGTYDKYYANFYATGYDGIDTVTLDGYLDQTDRDNFILSGNLIGEFEMGDIEHTLIFGAEFIDTTSEQFRFNPDFDPAPLTTADKANFAISQRDVPGAGFNAGGLDAGPFTDLQDNTRSDLSVYSLFLQDEIQLLEDLQLVVGLRFDSFDVEVEGINKTASNPTVITDISGNQRNEEITPRLGLVYKPKESISIYTSYSKTFLPPSGEQFADLGNAGLDPDEFTNLEAGLKWDFTQGFSLTTSIFEIQQDIIQSNGLGGSITEESEIQGFEAQIRGRITDDWFVSAGYSYLDGEDANGDVPREIPEHSFSFWNRYQLTEKLGLGLGAIYQDESYASNGAAVNRVTLPSFVRVDAAAYYQLTENLRLQLNIENLFDELYFPTAHADDQITVAAPIHARLSISGRF